MSKDLNIIKFFSMQQERYRMLLRRRGQLPRLEGGRLTDDPVLSAWRFCNVFREDDRTTQWFRENIREPLRDSRKVLLATVAFRWFNRIETGEKIKDLLLGEWDSAEARKRLYLQQPVVTGAFMIKTPPGKDKLDGVLWCINQFAFDAATLAHGWDPVTGHGEKGSLSLQVAWEVLTNFPFLGGFMAYEVVTDLRHTMYLENAPDIMTWANAGPGCARGAGRVFHDAPGHWNPSSSRDQGEMLAAMKELLEASRVPELWPSEWPRWEMREVEHGLCEYDKMCRGLAGERLKRRYP